MRSITLFVLFMGCVTPADRVGDARGLCETYYGRAIAWIEENDVSEWPDDREDYRALYWSTTVQKALDKMVAEMPPPHDPWGEQLVVHIYNETFDSGWLPALRVMSRGPNRKHDLEAGDDIYYPPR